MKTFDLEGDFDYAWINCSDDDDPTLLDHAVHEGSEIDRTRPINLEVGGYGSKGDWVETDCPRRPAYGTVLLSERAIDVFGAMLTDAGYVLETRLAAMTRYKLFLCQREIDALDQERSDLTRFRDGGVWEVLRHELRGDLLRGMDVFRLTHLRSQVFVSDRFVARAEVHGLTGFIFTEIWSSDTGGVPLTLPGIPIQRVPGEFSRDARKKRQALRKELARRAAQQPTSAADGSPPKPRPR